MCFRCFFLCMFAVFGVIFCVFCVCLYHSVWVIRMSRTRIQHVSCAGEAAIPSPTETRGLTFFIVHSYVRNSCADGS